MTDDMAVYIANLGKYNEGELVGAWFTFPIDEDDVAERIGLNEYYENTLSMILKISLWKSENMFPYQELNRIYEMVEELPTTSRTHWTSLSGITEV